MSDRMKGVEKAKRNAKKLYNSCACCHSTRRDGAHILTSSKFPEFSYYTEVIIPLCPSHHTKFDRVYTIDKKIEFLWQNVHSGHRITLMNQIARLQRIVKRKDPNLGIMIFDIMLWLSI